MSVVMEVFLVVQGSVTTGRVGIKDAYLTETEAVRVMKSLAETMANQHSRERIEELCYRRINDQSGTRLHRVYLCEWSAGYAAYFEVQRLLVKSSPLEALADQAE